MVQSQWPYWLPLRSDLRNISPYGAPQIEGVIALNTNENPFPLPGEVAEAMSIRLNAVIGNLNRYPDRDAHGLRQKLAHYITQSTGVELSEENVWAANGSNEILQTLFLHAGERITSRWDLFLLILSTHLLHKLPRHRGLLEAGMKILE